MTRTIGILKVIHTRTGNFNFEFISWYKKKDKRSPRMIEFRLLLYVVRFIARPLVPHSSIYIYFLLIFCRGKNSFHFSSEDGFSIRDKNAQGIDTLALK